MVAEQNSGASAPSRSRIISRLLPPAVQLWLRSQLQAVEALQFQIEGGDRQILSGHIPSVTIAAQNVVFQDIAISEIRAIGQGIRVNLGEIVRGNPLRLLNLVPVQAEVRLTEADLNTSLQMPLLSNAVTELLRDWLQIACLDGLPEPFDRALLHSPVQLHGLRVSLLPGQLVLAGTIISFSEQQTTTPAELPFAITTGLQVMDGSTLQLDRPHGLEPRQSSHGKLLTHLDGYKINLGSDVTIQQLALEAGQITCCGAINVLP